MATSASIRARRAARITRTRRDPSQRGHTTAGPSRCSRLSAREPLASRGPKARRAVGEAAEVPEVREHPAPRAVGQGQRPARRSRSASRGAVRSGPSAARASSAPLPRAGGNERHHGGPARERERPPSGASHSSCSPRGTNGGCTSRKARTATPRRDAGHRRRARKLEGHPLVEALPAPRGARSRGPSRLRAGAVARRSFGPRPRGGGPRALPRGPDATRPPRGRSRRGARRSPRSPPRARRAGSKKLPAL